MEHALIQAQNIENASVEAVRMVNIEDVDIVGNQVDYNSIITFIALGGAGQVVKIEATLKCINTESEKSVVSAVEIRVIHQPESQGLISSVANFTWGKLFG